MSKWVGLGCVLQLSSVLQWMLLLIIARLDKTTADQFNWINALRRFLDWASSASTLCA